MCTKDRAADKYTKNKAILSCYSRTDQMKYKKLVLKNTCLIAVCCVFLSLEGKSQDIGIYEPSENEKLSTIAYDVFKTNKFLNFKDADTLKEYVSGIAFKSTGLDTFFDRKKDWEKISDEDTSSYRSNAEKYSYQYTDSSMTEEYSKYGSYGVHREFKTVYNPKGFIIYLEEQVFLNDNLTETRSTRNTFDQDYRVIKIIKSIRKRGGKDSSGDIITVSYNGNSVLIKSQKNGAVQCMFINKRNR